MDASLHSCLSNVQTALAHSDPYELLEAAAEVEGTVEQQLGLGTKNSAICLRARYRKPVTDVVAFLYQAERA
eukprot:811185-Rhodomonas_salina.3